MRRRFAVPLAAVALSLPLALLPAASASAAPADKPQVLSSWTQTNLSSYNAWNTARNNQGAWAAYGFDWSTDYCSSSPDNPFGFPSKRPAPGMTSATATTRPPAPSPPTNRASTPRSTPTSNAYAPPTPERHSPRATARHGPTTTPWTSSAWHRPRRDPTD